MRETIKREANANLQELLNIRNFLYENPEIGGFEDKASALLTETLEAHGFAVERQFHGIDHAFRAAYGGTKPGPVIGYLCEFDAMPDTGHSCGHNLIATMALGAAFALKGAVDELGGTIVVFGTPGEENLCTKVQMSEEEVFDELDVAMMVHPSPVTEASGVTLAIDSVQIEFFGYPSHAGQSPEKGINALDAAVTAYMNINLEKQYLKGTNIYGIINDGGNKASTIPEHASLKYLLRAKNKKTLEKVNDMVRRCAEAASVITGATYKIWNNEPANRELLTNEVMSEIFNRNLMELEPERVIHRTENTGSSDIGDVSQIVPTIHPWLGVEDENLQLHSREFAEKTISPAGDKVLLLGSTSLALTGYEILNSKEVLDQIKKEFIEKKEMEQ